MKSGWQELQQISKREIVLYYTLALVLSVALVITVYDVDAELFSYKYYGQFTGSFKNNVMLIDGSITIQDTKPFRFAGVGLFKQVDSKGLHIDCTNVNSYLSSIRLDNSDILWLVIEGKLCDAGNDWKTYRGTYKIISSKMQFTQKVLGDGVLVMTVNPDGKIIVGTINGVVKGF